MRNKRRIYLILATLLIAAYYLLMGIYLNKLGYYNQESLFYIEKSKILLEGLGNRLKVMGLTAPILPFYGSFIFAKINPLLAPVIASAIGTTVLFYLMATSLIRRTSDDFYLWILVVLFLFHPGLLYTACSGKSIYLILIFFYLFFFHIIRFYTSNTTFHISIASICMVILVFCDYKFIWLTLFFIPLVLFIATQSLNLGEKETIFRLYQSFNNPTLRRKLVNKTFAIYIILFILPLASILIFKMLNLTHANDFDYFLDSPYATWTVLTDRITFEQATSFAHHQSWQISPLVTASVVLYCPMILVAIYFFRNSTYKILTIATPFALIEFLQIKYDKIFLSQEYFLIFLVLALLCVIFKSWEQKHQLSVKILLSILVVFQIITGYFFLDRSFLNEEREFTKVLFNQHKIEQQNTNRDMAEYINTSIPRDAEIMMDDAIAYSVIAYTHHAERLILPYQETYLSASEAPEHYANYILIATEQNSLTGYTQLNYRYIPAIKHSDSKLKLHKVYETDDWILYKIL